MKRYIRSKINGMIFDYDEILAGNPNAEIITEAEAYPERMRPKVLDNHAQKVVITVPKEVTEAPAEAPEALRLEATARAAKVTASNTRLKTKKEDFAGLMGDF